MADFGEFLRALEPLAIFAAGALGARLLWGRGLRARRIRPDGPAIAMLALFAGTALLYPFLPSFNNNIEPAVADLACLAAAGRPVYVDPASGPCLNQPYGPGTYLLPAMSILLGLDPITGPKLAGLAQMLAALALLALALARRHGGRAAVRGLGLAALLLATFKHFAYWDRAESLLLAASGLAVLALTVHGRGRASALFALGAALAAAAKPTGLLYLLPCVPVLARRQGKPAAATALVLGIAAGFLPFVHPLFPWAPFAAHLKTVVAAHAFEGPLLVSVFLRLLLVGLLPLAWAAARGRLGFGRCDAAAWLTAALGILAVGSKDGAGPHHVLPLVPAVVWAVGPALGGGRAPVPRHRPWLAAGALVLAVAAFKGQRSVVRYLARGPRFAAARAELAALLAALPSDDVAAGFTDGSGEELSYLRPLVAAKGGRVFVERPSVREYSMAGLDPPPALAGALARGPHRYFVLPARGAPFRLAWKPRRPSFTLAPLARAFRARYEPERRGRWFTLWRRRP